MNYQSKSINNIFRKSELKVPKKEKLNLITRFNNKKADKTKVSPDDLLNKDNTMKNYYQYLNKIKKDSIREFIYTNQKVPKKWRLIKGYQNMILDLFSEDKDFFSYVGHYGQNEVKEDDNKPQIATTNISNNNIKNSKSSSFFIMKSKFNKTNLAFNQINNNRINDYIAIPNSLKKNRNRNRNRNQNEDNFRYLSENEVENIFTEYNKRYPIKEKLFDLFPHRIVNNIINRNINLNSYKHKSLSINNNKTKIDELINKEKGIRKKVNNIRNSIFSSLLSSSSPSSVRIKKPTSPIPKNNINSFINNVKNQSFDKKIKIKSKLVKNLLKKVNYYGPYFSHCPQCRNRNINFYNELEENQSIKFLKFIQEKKRHEKMERESE